MIRRIISRTVKRAGSLNIAIFLLTVIAIVCGWATFVELDFGTSAAQQLIYRSGWFYALGFLLAVNILCATLARLPWRLKHLPFLIAHAGILLLLAGCWLTHYDTLEGEMAIFEGEESAEAIRSDRRAIFAQFRYESDGIINPSHSSLSVAPANNTPFSEGKRGMEQKNPNVGIIKRRTVKIPFSGGVFNRSAYSRDGWREQVLQPALDARPAAHGLADRLGRLVFRAHCALVRWAARASLKGQNRTLYDAGGLKIEQLDYRCGGAIDPFAPVSETPGPFDKERANEFYAQVKLRVTLDSTEQTFWLTAIPNQIPNTDVLAHTMAGKDRTCRLTLENERFDPGFSIRVKKFEARYEPGTTTASSFSSLVDCVPTDSKQADSDRSARRDVLIQMNKPLRYRAPGGRGFRVYQSSFRGPFEPGSAPFESMVVKKITRDASQPREKIYQTVLSLNGDPGRIPKYVGSILAIFGTLLMIRRKKGEKIVPEPVMTDAETPKIRLSRWIPAGIVFCAVLLLIPSAVTYRFGVTRSPIPSKNWTAWRLLPVWSHGRVMPLETFARQTVKEITGSVAPILAPDAELLGQIERGAFSELPVLERYLSDSKQTKEQTDEITAWYAEQKRGEQARLKKIADRIRVLFPENRPRRFSAHELLFAWIVEPEVWRMVPILADPENRVSAYLELKNGEKNTRAEHSRLTPAQIEKSEKFAALIDTIQKRTTRTYPDRESAIGEGRIERAGALVEKNLSLWRAVSFWPGKSVSPMTGFYLDRLLYSDDSAQGDAPLAELEQSVRRLKTLKELPENKGHATPFDDEAFELNQTVVVGKPPETIRVLRLLRKIHLLATLYAESPYSMNTKLFGSLLDDLTRTESLLRAHRDAIFASGEFSPAYRGELLRTTQLTGRIRETVASASIALSQLGTYKMTTLADRKRLAAVESGETVRWTASNAATLSIAESGSLDVCPFAASFEKIDGRAPWGALQTALFAEGELAAAFFGGEKIANSPSNADSNVSDSADGNGADGNGADGNRTESEGADDSMAAGPFACFLDALKSKKTALAEKFYAAASIYAEPNAGERSAELDSALDAFCGAVQASGENVAADRLWAEACYDRLDPFFWLWYLAFCSTVMSLLSLLARKGTCAVFLRLSATALLVLSASTAAVGMTLRGYISGWAPVTNMFETVVLLALMAQAATLCYAFSRRRFSGPILLGGMIAAIVGLLAYYNTAEFNPAIRPIAAVLRNNFWLAVHVSAIMAGYALGVLAWGIALAWTFSTWVRRPVSPDALARWTDPLLTLLRFTVLLLLLGTILGAYWADCSWGRFWSWDPKEVWALVTLCIYLIVLHRRYLPHGAQNGRLADGGIFGALAIVMTWYGLSFVFGGGGRHSYAAGETTKTTVLYLLIASNLLIIVAAKLHRRFVSE